MISVLLDVLDCEIDFFDSLYFNRGISICACGFFP